MAPLATNPPRPVSSASALAAKVARFARPQVQLEQRVDRVRVAGRHARVLRHRGDERQDDAVVGGERDGRRLLGHVERVADGHPGSNADRCVHVARPW
jgi:hypothetical protein